MVKVKVMKMRTRAKEATVAGQLALFGQHEANKRKQVKNFNNDTWRFFHTQPLVGMPDLVLICNKTVNLRFKAVHLPEKQAS